MKTKSLVTADAPALSLADAPARINAEHSACVSAMRNSLAHARTCGELLLQSKQLVTHGEWSRWLSENFAGSGRTAQNYMRLAKSWPAIAAKTQRVADLSYRQAVALIADERDAKLASPANPELPADLVDVAGVFLDVGAIHEGHAWQLLRLRKIYPDTTREFCGDRRRFTFEEFRDDENACWMYIRGMSPDDCPVCDFFGLKDRDRTIFAKACDAFEAHIWNHKHRPPAWTVGAFYWACVAAYHEFDTDALTNVITAWIERSYASITHLTLSPELQSGPIDSPLRKLMHIEWWGHWADLRHAGILKCVREQSTHRELIVEAMRLTLATRSIALPSCFQPWSPYYEDHRKLIAKADRTGEAFS